MKLFILSFIYSGVLFANDTSITKPPLDFIFNKILTNKTIDDQTLSQTNDLYLQYRQALKEKYGDWDNDLYTPDDQWHIFLSELALSLGNSNRCFSSAYYNLKQCPSFEELKTQYSFASPELKKLALLIPAIKSGHITDSVRLYQELRPLNPTALKQLLRDFAYFSKHPNFNKFFTALPKEL